MIIFLLGYELYCLLVTANNGSVWKGKIGRKHGVSNDAFGTDVKRDSNKHALFIKTFN